MIEITRHGDVTRLRLWTMGSRAVGYDVSAYLVRGVLVDTGFRHVRDDIERALVAFRPSGIIVTHWHEDHAGNAPTLAEAFPMWMPSGTEVRLRERPRLKLYRHFTWGRPLPLVALDRFDIAPLRAIPTPGHSDDHHVVWDPGTGTLFSGDLWLGVKVRVMGEHENPYEIIRSLDTAIALRPERMFDAHRGPVDRPVAALEAKRAWLSDTIGNIERRLAAGDAEDEILRSLLGGEELTALITRGEYARRNLVRCVARERATTSPGQCL